ncbi:M23 family metallopeptidase [Polycladidibacter hongkongensis]|uniref:M23 family metallopeptidase n=1 Tax=Polycladidibacter hongkongensis TaxID=1647556 RepID=UPI0008350D6F|nr:M23 family metallopeptidase [Pseudovibrio hongkongensis]
MHVTVSHHQRPLVELGNEPALLIEGASAGQNSSLNARWLIGTILTGVTSFTLMGGALLVALDGHHSISRANLTNQDSLAAELQSADAGKGDIASFDEDSTSNRRRISVNTVNRKGGRDFITKQPYAVVAADLLQAKLEHFEQEIPEFDPVAMYQGEVSGPSIIASDAVYGADIEGDLSISQKDFPTDLMGYATDNQHFTDHDILDQVKTAARFMSENATDIVSTPKYSLKDYSFSNIAQQDMENLQVRITQENVSFQPKTDFTQTSERVEERFMPVAEEAVFLDMLLDNEATEAEAKAILEAFSQSYQIAELEEGQVLRFGLSPQEDGGSKLIRVSLYDYQDHIATVARTDEGGFIASAAPTDEAIPDAFAVAEGGVNDGPTPTYYTSLYETALQNEIPREVVEELIRIYSFDLDYNATVKPGDKFNVIYSLNNKQTAAGIPEILYTSVLANGREHIFYRFRSPDDGQVDFYDRTGKSAKKFLLRKPITAGRFTSGYGMRRHPIRRTRTLHTGVDWAAPRGTPILAAGNGTIKKAGWGGGYGKRVILSHANGYETTYNHMVRIAEGLKAGQQVFQGQVIGYVGTTGLSTGNHLHYEVKVNGRFVNPLKIKLPKGRTLDGTLLTAFERERDRIDALREKKPDAQVVSGL